MSDIKQLLTEILSQHGWHEWREQCCCGWPGERFRETPSGKIQIDATCDEVDEHIADVLLSLPGIAIVELPEVQASGLVGQTEWPVKSRDDAAVVTIRLSDHKIINDGVSNPYSSPEAARSHAAALLAAARAAEQADADD